MAASPAREALWAALGAIAFGLAFSHPILTRLSEAGFHHDWDLLWQLQWVAYQSVVHFHQLPLWNPYKCGGMPLLANPHSRILTPFFLLHLLVGPVAGLHVEIPLHLAIAWAGGYLLARVQGLSPLAGVVSGTVFPASSWLYLHLAVGHVVYLPSLYLPWIAALVWLGMTRRRLVFAALAGLLVALTLGEGGVYPVPQALLLIALLGLAAAVDRRSPWPLVTVVVAAAFSFGFAAVKLFPAHELLQSHPPPVRTDEVNPLARLGIALLSRNQDLFRDHPGARLGPADFHEYGAYVGPLAAALAALGIVTSPRRVLPWLLSGAAFLALSSANALGPMSPWALLHHLPVFSAERVATRFLIPCTLTIGMMGAFGAEFLRSHFGRRGAILAYLSVAALVIDLWSIGPPNLRYVFGGSEVVRPVEPEFRQAATTAATFQMLSFAQANMGAIECYEYTPFFTKVRGVEEALYRGEQYLLGPGSVRLSGWTPNALRYEVDSSAPTVLVVNQNYDASWRLLEGDGEVFSQAGLLAVRLPAGRARVVLGYRSRPFLAGLVVTTLTFVALIVLKRRG